MKALLWKKASTYSRSMNELQRRTGCGPEGIRSRIGSSFAGCQPAILQKGLRGFRAEYAEIKNSMTAVRLVVRKHAEIARSEKAREGIKVAEVDHTKDILAAAVAKEKVAAARFN